MILQRYFVREALKASAAIVVGLFVIYLSTRFAASLGAAAEGKIAPQHIARIVSLKMLVSLKDLVPMGLFLGSFAAVVRLQRDFEWVAMRAAGVSHQQLLRAALGLTAAAAALVALVTLVIEPRAEQMLQEIKQQTENEATIAGVRAGRFKELGGGRQVFYAESVASDQRSLENAFVQTRSGRDAGLLRSKRAYVETFADTRDRFAVFENGVSYAGNPGELDYVITDFDRYALRIENREPAYLGGNVNYLLTSQLLRIRGTPFATELQWRLALPICTLLGPLLAVLVGAASSGGRWYLGLVTAISGYFFYSNMLGVGKALMKKELLSTAVGLWPIHLAFVGVLVSLLWWQRRSGKLGTPAKQQLLRA